jgi:para-nitrobenzyl esterase
MVNLVGAERAGIEFAKLAGAASLAELRAKPASEILKVQDKQGIKSSWPIVDGYVLPEGVYTIFMKRQQNDVPVMQGTNEDEGTVFVRPTTLVAFKADLSESFRSALVHGHGFTSRW